MNRSDEEADAGGAASPAWRRDLEVEALVAARMAERDASRLARLDAALRVLLGLLSLAVGSLSFLLLVGDEGVRAWMAVVAVAAGLAATAQGALALDRAAHRARERAAALRRAAVEARLAGTADAGALAGRIAGLREGAVPA